MNIVILRGVLSSAPVLRSLASGSVVVSLEVTTPLDTGTASVPVAWFDPPSEVPWGPGDEVCVLGTVRRRFFRSGGVTQSRTEVVATQVVAAGNRRQVQRLLQRAVSRLGPQPEGALRSV
ncbi:MAG: hypothetical protein F2681_17765 [Actinobacteria bacterium]|uniref:Unannotated protein n=1 Tax=freshwater metagenome TaxID=449393 RepID=A0A6J6TZ28_9ZZZZ|nr:hypothetical protein [Actinomycetota bacterium]MSX56516.1 hypothetical protein [Actinomycetota bacterium]MSZ84976.1 hypothetical protein [Actinomycetota bacterium]MTB18741.1 hypothetical protein [Actinomycetota bacterium]